MPDLVDDYMLELMAFSSVLRHEGRACFNRGEDVTTVRGIIKNVTQACDLMLAACDKFDADTLARTKPATRTLTPEEYEAKVAAGKKLTFSEDQGKSPRRMD